MLTLCLRYPPLYGCPRTAVLTSDTQEWELQLDRGWGGGRSILWLLDAGRAMELHLSSRANRRA